MLRLLIQLTTFQMGEILQLSRAEYEFINRRDPNHSVGSGSGATVASSRAVMSLDKHREHLNGRIAEIDRNINGCDKKIKELQTQRALWSSERDELWRELQQLPSQSVAATVKGKGVQTSIDYHSESFPWPWSKELEETMKNVFNIEKFRLCQRG